MCLPVGWAGKVSESIRFRTKINTILADDHFGISAPLLCCLGILETRVNRSARAVCLHVNQRPRRLGTSGLADLRSRAIRDEHIDSA